MRQINNKVRIAIVDSNNKVIGSMARDDAIKKGKSFRTVHIFAKNDDMLLLQKLANTHLKSPGLIGSTAAGYMLENESSHEAAQRIMMKELRCPANELSFVGITKMRDGKSIKYIDIYRASIDTPVMDNENEFTRIIKMRVENVKSKLSSDPDFFTSTFPEVFSVWLKSDD